MRALVISDLHGTSPATTWNLLKKEDPTLDTLIILGDIERVDAAEEVLHLLDTNPAAYFVLGNHDYAHVTRQPIKSGTMHRQGINSPDMWVEWANPTARDARALIEGAFTNTHPSNHVARRIAIPLGSDHAAVLMHGAYAGSQADGEPVPEPRDLWNRLLTKEDLRRNFEIMRQKRNGRGYDLMVRGHDHAPRLAIQNREAIQTITPQPRQRFRLEGMGEGVRYVFQPGSLHLGLYGILDTSGKTTQVEFRKDPRLAFNPDFTIPTSDFSGM